MKYYNCLINLLRLNCLRHFESNFLRFFFLSAHLFCKQCKFNFFSFENIYSRSRLIDLIGKFVCIFTLESTQTCIILHSHSLFFNKCGKKIWWRKKISFMKSQTIIIRKNQLFLQFNIIQLMLHGIHVRRGAFVTVNITPMSLR